jgi:hypothetical protein
MCFLAGYALASKLLTGGDIVGVQMLGDGYAPTVVVAVSLTTGAIAVAAWRIGRLLLDRDKP